jgi:hypothetical protein
LAAGVAGPGAGGPSTGRPAGPVEQRVGDADAADTVGEGMVEAEHHSGTPAVERVDDGQGPEWPGRVEGRRGVRLGDG